MLPRRHFLRLLSALPFCGWLGSKPASAGWSIIRRRGRIVSDYTTVETTAGNSFKIGDPWGLPADIYGPVDAISEVATVSAETPTLLTPNGATVFWIGAVPFLDTTFPDGEIARTYPEPSRAEVRHMIHRPSRREVVVLMPIRDGFDPATIRIGGEGKE